MKILSTNLYNLKLAVTLLLCILLPFKSAYPQENPDLKKYLPLQKDLPDHDFSKVRFPNQIKNSTSQSINFYSTNKTNTHSIRISICHTDSNATSELLIKKILRNNPGNTWTKGFLFSSQIGSYCAHTETARGKIRDSMSFVASEGKSIVVIQYHRLPANLLNQSAKYANLSDYDIRIMESLISNIFQKMRHDGLTK